MDNQYLQHLTKTNYLENLNINSVTESDTKDVKKDSYYFIYLKYKNKYLTLKEKLIGGAQNSLDLKIKKLNNLFPKTLSS